MKSIKWPILGDHVVIIWTHEHFSVVFTQLHGMTEHVNSRHILTIKCFVTTK